MWPDQPVGGERSPWAGGGAEPAGPPFVSGSGATGTDPQARACGLLLGWAAVGAVPESARLPAEARLQLAEVPLEGAPPWLGIDRALAGWWGWRLAAGPVLVADAGTVLSFTRMDRAGRFAGGRLWPGSPCSCGPWPAERPTYRPSRHLPCRRNQLPHGPTTQQARCTPECCGASRPPLPRRCWRRGARSPTAACCSPVAMAVPWAPCWIRRWRWSTGPTSAWRLWRPCGQRAISPDRGRRGSDQPWFRPSPFRRPARSCLRRRSRRSGGACPWSRCP